MIEKIKALLALAANPASQGAEAETAARHAAKLMAKYDLDEFDLISAGKAEWDLIQGEATGCRPGKKNAKIVPPWIGVIAMGVKAYTGVRASSGTGGIIFFQGRRSDVELAQWLHRALVELAYDASQKASGPPTAFRNGFASALQGRLKKMAADRDETNQGDALTGVSGTSLVVIKSRLATAMDERWGADSSGRPAGGQRSNEGYSAGQNAHIPTARPISGTRTAGYLS